MKLTNSEWAPLETFCAVHYEDKLRSAVSDVCCLGFDRTSSDVVKCNPRAIIIPRNNSVKLPRY